MIVRSENPRGTRGHTMFISRADVDLRYAAFVELGRTRNGAVDSTRLDTRGRTRRIGTNQLGRYAVHFHHAFGPRTPPANGYQFTLIGNAVDGAPKWGITVHRSHYGLVRDNVVYDTRGAGIATEDGSESLQRVRPQLLGALRRPERVPARSGLRRLGAGRGRPRAPASGSGGPTTTFATTSPPMPATYGFGLPAELGSVRVPAFQGADTSRPGEAVLTDMANAAVLEFADNEAYGALETGLETIWNGTVSGLTVWHPSRQAFAGNPPERLVLDGLTVRGDLAALGETGEAPVGVLIANYLSRHVTVANADVQGMRVGVLSPFFYNQTPEPGRGPGALVVEDGYFRNHVDVSIATAYAAGAPGAAPVKRAEVRGSVFEPLGVRPADPWPRESISANYETTPGDGQPRDPIFVYDYNDQAGNDFKVYYSPRGARRRRSLP